MADRRVVSAIVGDADLTEARGSFPVSRSSNDEVGEPISRHPIRMWLARALFNTPGRVRWRSRPTTSKTPSSPSPPVPAPSTDRPQSQNRNPLTHKPEGFPMTTALPPGMSTTFLRTDLRRVLRSRRALVFAVIMPAVLYLVFGATQKSSTQSDPETSRSTS